MSSSSVKKTTAWIVRAGVEAVLLLIFIVPQYFVPDENVEVFRLACSTVVTAAACIVSWNLPRWFIVFSMYLLVRSSRRMYISMASCWSLVFSHLNVLCPTSSFLAYRTKRARVSEAEALLHEYMGNEQLLFVKLRRAYLARQPPTRVVLKGT
ncbi:hypothetical protein Ae201684P_020907 [Aphanomyces euteiches]|nr:hypothetical protein Ae201684P_020907 [Aphanomyces euteiches]